ncbi:MAG TPA: RES family NAD+ phosphorylase [Verrucomicrobiae bacterium]|nr:RES family NAD+ phosphorylase [Verrucomicrobiae bacterium]
MALDSRLPPPPSDLAARKLPLVTIRGDLFRIHRAIHTWRHFGRNMSERFDDAQGVFGVLYASTTPDAAFAEVFLRKLASMSVAQVDLEARAISTLKARPPRCVELTGSGLRKLSCDNRISTETPYQTTRLWSRALFLHPQQPDGLVYRSRHNPRFRCLALFDRCDAKLTEVRSEPLMDPPRRAWCSVQLDRYALAMT